MIKKLIIALVIGGVGAAAIFFVQHREEILHFPEVLPTFQAKEMCTCLFVHEQSAPDCEEVVRQWIPHKEIRIERETKKVVAHSLGVTRSAEFVSDRLGCRLITNPVRAGSIENEDTP